MPTISSLWSRRPSGKHRRLGQHFLRDRGVRDRIIAAARLGREDTILEIGAGRGELTLALAPRVRRVVAVEKDPRLAAALAAALAHRGLGNVTVVTGDILKLFPGEPDSESSSLLPGKLALPAHYRVVANIPYYLTSRLIRRLLESPHPPAEIILMVQREVAERLTARPPRMNLLAISAQLYGEPEMLFAVPRAAFSPQPWVDSALISIRSISPRTLRRAGLSAGEFFRVVRAGFAGRRKTIANALARGLVAPKDEIAALLRRAGVDAARRSETLTIGEWFSVTRLIREMTPGQ